MAVNVKTLLKKGKLTGDEVGRLMIKDLVATYKNAVEHRTLDGVLTDSEKQSLVDNLEKKEDIRRYADYKYIHDFLEKAPILFGLYQQTASISFWKLYHRLQVVYSTENEISREWRNNPKIVTQKQYDDMKRENLEGQLNNNLSPEMLLIHTVNYYLDKYKDGKRTAFNKYFTASKKQPITNPRIKENYWEDNGYYTLPDGRKSKNMSREEWHTALSEYEAYAGMKEAVDGKELTAEEILKNNQTRLEADNLNLEWTSDYTAPEDATMFDVLEYLEGFYFSEETDNKETVFEFMTDFPDLYKAIWEHITKMKGLSFLQELSKDDFTNWDLISCRLLYENNLLNFKEYFEEFCPDGFAGIAVIQSSGINTKIDENGYYKELDPYWRKNDTADYLLEEESDLVSGLLESLKYHLKYAYSVKAAVNIVGKFIAVEDVNILIDEVKEHEIEGLNMLMAHLIDAIDRGDYEANEQIRKQLQGLLLPVKIKELKPTPEAIKAAKEKFDFTTLQQGSNDFLALLAGEPSDYLEEVQKQWK